ncbi:MAG: OmpA family protein [Bacteroidota bacterium]
MRNLILTVALAIPGLVFAQSTNLSTLFYGRVKKADIYFNHYAYRNALHLYLHANDKDPKNAYVKRQIAECYFKLHNPSEAEKWYAQIIDDPKSPASVKYEYGEVLSMNGKYEESKKWFAEFLKDNPDHRAAKDKVEFLDRIEYYENDSLEFIVANTGFNTEHSEYGAHYFHKGIAFSSSRDVDALIKHKAFDAVDEDESLLNMYYVPSPTFGQFGKVEPLHQEKIKSFLHEGPMSFYSGNTKAVFNRTNMKRRRPLRDASGKAHLQIYFADINELNSLANVTAFEHNNPRYSVAHPSVSPDGRFMVFSSTIPGGEGSADIYLSENINGKWTIPQEIGANVNTEGDESFPFLANDSTLYFSSNGHGSLGGLDVLVSYKRKGVFTRPVNFGGPLNTRYDDFAFATDQVGRQGYIASNRPGGSGLDDIYYFIANYFFLKGIITGTFPEGAIGGVELSAFDRSGKFLGTTKTDDKGYFSLRVPFDADITVKAAKEGYDTNGDFNLSTRGSAFGIDSVNLKLWKHELFAKGKIYSNESQQPLTGVSIRSTDLAAGKVEEANTGDSGEYNLLLRPEKKYNLEFSKPGYVTKNLEINTAGMVRGNLLNDVLMEEEFLATGVINFEYKRSRVTPAGMKVIKPMLETLKQNPAAKVNIGAHADARGSSDFNQRLTEDRAKNTMKYFVKQGIDAKRITYQGFGEKLVLNRCSDGVKCPENEHSVNRRAEIKVQR